MAEIDPDGLLQEALATVMTDFVSHMPLYATLVIHLDPVMTEDTVVWSVKVGKVVSKDGVIEQVPPDG